MKIFIDEDDRYPDYSVLSPSNHEEDFVQLDVDEETVKRWKQVIEDYNKVQREIGTLVCKARKEQ